MLFQITILKAPWPKGAKVGDVLDMPVLPAWAVGKCRIAIDATAATIDFVPPAPAVQVDAEPAPDDLHAKVQRLEAQVADLQKLLGNIAAPAPAPDALAEHVKQPQESAQTAVSAVDEQAAYELAQADEKAALKAEAEALGIKVDARWGAKRLSEEIAAAKG